MTPMPRLPVEDQPRTPLRPAKGEPLLVSARAAADLLGISKTLMYQLLGRGEIPSVRIGSSRRVAVDDLRVYVEANKSWR